jgi:hypothetical protein
MKLPRSGGGKLGLEVLELADHERPPMIAIPEYLERRRTAGMAGGAAVGAAAGGSGFEGDGVGAGSTAAGSTAAGSTAATAPVRPR